MAIKFQLLLLLLQAFQARLEREGLVHLRRRQQTSTISHQENQAAENRHWATERRYFYDLWLGSLETAEQLRQRRRQEDQQQGNEEEEGEKRVYLMIFFIEIRNVKSYF